jgi:DegV family protein with EDD domain
MDRAYKNAFVIGYERMAAWSDLLDEINVFPVPDADTGRNLKISLAPLRQLDERPEGVRRRILRAATGNAGNIASVLVYELLNIDGPAALTDAIRRGSQLANKAVAEPKPGTMLTLFEVLAQAVPAAEKPPTEWDLETIIALLERCVDDTSNTLPEFREVGVVDSGALGMFIFLESFLDCLAGRADHGRPVTERFDGKLKIPADWKPCGHQEQYCVSAVIRPEGNRAEQRPRLVGWGKSLVVNESEDLLRVHVHTDDCSALRRGLSEIGRVLDWSREKIVPVQPTASQAPQPVHIMTDAAGSVTLEDARNLGMTLLDSYLLVGDQSYPETLYPSDALYAAMAGGLKVSTAQASVFQRHQSYLSAVNRFDRVLYLCVGSVYTGNFETATSWQAAHDAHHRLTVIDTGTASGRLGIVALATARFARHCREPEAVVRFAREVLTRSQELVFLDQLKYLAAGGRISITGGFFGDLLHIKPIVTPSARGAAKVGVVRSREGQLGFALKRLGSCFEPGDAPLILLQYSDNRDWVEKVAARELQSLLPAARILVRPLSLTSGAHMGPGTWAVAFLPGAFDRQAWPLDMIKDTPVGNDV